MTGAGVHDRGTPPPVAIIGVGNVLLSDEGVGIHVVRALRHQRVPRRIELIDGGTGGLALLNLMRDREKVIIVDAVSLRAPPGAMYRWLPSSASTQASPYRTAHAESVDEILRVGRTLGILPRIICIGIVPSVIDTPSSTLSPVLRRQFPAIVRTVLREGIQRRAPCGRVVTFRICQQDAREAERAEDCWGSMREP